MGGVNKSLSAEQSWRLICALEGTIPKATDPPYIISVWLMLNPFFDPRKQALAGDPPCSDAS